MYDIQTIKNVFFSQKNILKLIKVSNQSIEIIKERMKSVWLESYENLQFIKLQQKKDILPIIKTLDIDVLYKLKKIQESKENHDIILPPQSVPSSLMQENKEPIFSEYIQKRETNSIIPNTATDSSKLLEEQNSIMNAYVNQYAQKKQISISDYEKQRREFDEKFKIKTLEQLKQKNIDIQKLNKGDIKVHIDIHKDTIDFMKEPENYTTEELNRFSLEKLEQIKKQLQEKIQFLKDHHVYKIIRTNL